MEMVVIPEGWFWMGSGEGQPGQQDERPRHRVWVDAFEMARTQVTRREYEQFLAATGRPPPRYWNQSEFSNPDQRDPVGGCPPRDSRSQDISLLGAWLT